MSEVVFLFDGWDAVARILVVGTLGYISLVLLIRVGTKRALAQLSPFDFVITVALGSAYGRVLTATEVGLTEAVTAFALLIGLQYILASAQIRWPRFAKLLKSKPALLYYKGEFLYEAMRREKITEKELEAAVRQQGVGSFANVAAIVMESDGGFSVIQTAQQGDENMLKDVKGRSE
ncbi:hypothetical protein CAI21_19615 [Alkalilimnicola ehrlichii]|uniref:DUF421 domain-containing protein n=1 Tax=Alkalilimnicola ehrlichii TaxID=351052 RepID=A0A3E0WII6_9GAMM|nr:YetF domain-containing protein [Alkalilimnicola ehrlichii]RFA25180.1 hypothetical protein CAI21_19615 [Alkalilimnicola ehrlichii]RFA32259.1 hypothetical protein CAL65_20035 [Alkalilimnicola ehrlichii]